jgi:hypothetical protein
VANKRNPNRHALVAIALTALVALGVIVPFQLAGATDGGRAARRPQTTATQTVTATRTVTSMATVTATVTATVPGPTVTVTAQPPQSTSTTTANPTSTAKPTSTATATSTPTATSTATATSTPTTTSTPTATSTPTGLPAPASWPNASTTGVPAGVALTAYTGPMTVTQAGAVIDAKTITGSITIAAPNVTISRSQVNGFVGVGDGGSLIIKDTRINIGDRPGTGLGEHDFTALRIHVTGGNRSVNCYSDCTIRDSYVHGQFADPTGVYHESGIRMGERTNVIHNTIACDAPAYKEAGCSAGLTGYGDFNPVADNLIQDNWFKQTLSGGTCAYGGASGGKAYSNDSHDVRFINNIFERGTSGNCGIWFAILDYDDNAPGTVFSGNTWDNGGAV